MPLFVCDKCKVVENTACGHYWTRNMGLEDGKKEDSRALCSECMPGPDYLGRGGKWHGKFPKVIATTEIIKEYGEDNFVYMSDIKGVKIL